MVFAGHARSCGFLSSGVAAVVLGRWAVRAVGCDLCQWIFSGGKCVAREVKSCGGGRMGAAGFPTSGLVAQDCKMCQAAISTWAVPGCSDSS